MKKDSHISELKELMLLVSKLGEKSDYFGSTHLNKILYLADFYHFKLTGKPITGAEYFKLPHGPGPKHLVPAQKQLIAEGRLSIEERVIAPERTQKRPVVTGEINEDVFTPAQRDFVSKFVVWACQIPASQLSILSHRHLAWELAELNETIPYYTIHCTGVNPITESTKQWAAQVATAANLTN